MIFKIVYTVLIIISLLYVWKPKPKFNITTEAYQSEWLTVIPVNSQTSNKMEWQDSQANVLKEWRADGTVWAKGVYLGKAETLAEAMIIIGNTPGESITS